MATRDTVVWCFLLIFVSASSGSSKKLECTKLGPCSCQMSDGSGVIDLATLGNAGSEPTQVDARYKDVRARDASSYSFNPCWPFEEVGCHGVALCQRVPDRRFGLFFTIGLHDTAQFLHNGTHVILKYEGKTGTSQVVRTSWITLVCNKENEDTIFSPIGEDPYVQPLHYYFEFKTPCACAGKCQKDAPKEEPEVEAKVEAKEENKDESKELDKVENNEVQDDEVKDVQNEDIHDKNSDENKHDVQEENKVALPDKEY
ncbi:uncharacterized protein LOC144450895 [Glandiceps talaboti]